MAPRVAERRMKERRTIDRSLTSRIFWPYVVILIAGIFAFWALETETDRRIRVEASLRKEFAQANRDRIHDVERVNQRQDLLIRQLQEKFPGEFKQPGDPVHHEGEHGCQSTCHQ